MGLRLAEGVDLGRIAELAGRYPVDRDAVERLERQGLLEREGDRLRATPAGNAGARFGPERDRAGLTTVSPEIQIQSSRQACDRSTL